MSTTRGMCLGDMGFPSIVRVDEITYGTDMRG